MSLAIAGVADASGQIVYTDVDPDAGGVQFIDLDGDINNDFLLNFVGSQAVRGVPIGGSSANSLGNAFIGITASSFNYPANLSPGAVISSGAGWNSVYAYHDFCYAGGYSNSNFCGETDGYMGLRFDIGGSYHYGWARIDVTTSGGVSDYVLKDYAYNSTPGASINAGQQALGIDENQFSNVRISALNKAITISNLTNNAEYVLFDLSGKTVMNGEAKNNNHVIEANFMATGVYILQLKDINTDAVIRKKVIL